MKRRRVPIAGSQRTAIRANLLDGFFEEACSSAARIGFF